MAVLAHAMQQRGDRLGMCCGLNHTELKHAAAQIEKLLTTRKSLSSAFAGGMREEEAFAAAVEDLGDIDEIAVTLGDIHNQDKIPYI